MALANCMGFFECTAPPWGLASLSEGKLATKNDCAYQVFWMNERERGVEYLFQYVNQEGGVQHSKILIFT